MGLFFYKVVFYNSVVCGGIFYSAKNGFLKNIFALITAVFTLVARSFIRFFPPGIFFVFLLTFCLLPKKKRYFFSCTFFLVLWNLPSMEDGNQVLQNQEFALSLSLSLCSFSCFCSLNSMSVFFFFFWRETRVLSLHPPLGILGVQKFFCTKPFRKVYSELSPHTSGRRARFARAPP